MTIFGLGYQYIEMKYISPLINYEVPFDRLNENNIKYLLKEKIKNVSYSSNMKEIYIEFDYSDAINALLGDIEYFNMRIIAQSSNLSLPLTSCWNFVTHYYFYFFIGTIILRFFHRGNLYLTNEEAQDILSKFLLYNSEPYNLSRGNYIYKFNILNDCIKMTLKNVGGKGPHETTWDIIFNEILVEIHSKSKIGDTEFTSLTLLRNYSQYRNKILSILRNKINYQPVYGYKSILNSIDKPNILYNESDWFEKISTYIYDQNSNNNDDMEFCDIYGSYFFMLYCKLYKSYINRREHKTINPLIVNFLNHKNLDFL